MKSMKLNEEQIELLTELLDKRIEQGLDRIDAQRYLTLRRQLNDLDDVMENGLIVTNYLKLHSHQAA